MVIAEFWKLGSSILPNWNPWSPPCLGRLLWDVENALFFYSGNNLHIYKYGSGQSVTSKVYVILWYFTTLLLNIFTTGNGEDCGAFTYCNSVDRNFFQNPLIHHLAHFIWFVLVLFRNTATWQSVILKVVTTWIPILQGKNRDSVHNISFFIINRKEAEGPLWRHYNIAAFKN